MKSYYEEWERSGVEKGIKKADLIIKKRSTNSVIESVRDESRTHTAARPLPPQSSVSTNSTTRT